MGREAKNERSRGKAVGLERMHGDTRKAAERRSGSKVERWHYEN